MTCLVTGTARLPSGVLLPSTVFTFTRSPKAVRAQDGALVVPGVISATANGSGAISLSLYPGRYSATESTTGSKFAFNVPDADTADWTTCVQAASAGELPVELAAANVTMSGGGTAQDYAGFATRAAFVTWASGKTPTPGTLVGAAGVDYCYLSTGTAISDLPGWVPLGEARPEHWAQNVTPGSTVMTAAIQAAMDYSYNDGKRGGFVRFKPETYLIDATLIHRRGVYLVGEGWFFNMDYTVNRKFTGSQIKLKTGSNCNMLDVQADVTELTGSQATREHGGMRDLLWNGNRTATAGMTATELNSGGHGINIKGASYFTVDNCAAVMCALRGFNAGSFDYGGTVGNASCNNLNWRNVLAILNADDGFSLYGGDSTYHQLVAGFNGGNGLSFGGGAQITGSRFWDNSGRGAALSDKPIFIGNACYDNGLAGASLNGTDLAVVVGNQFHQNGKLETGVATETCGLLISGVNTTMTIDGNYFGNDVRTSQARPIYCNEALVPVSLGVNTSRGHTVTDAFVFTDWTNVKMHGDMSASAKHSGFVLDGTINGNNNRIINARSVSRNAWDTITTITANTLAVAFNDIIVLNVSGGGTINDITCSIEGIPRVTIRNTNATSVTITHNNAKLRCNGAANITLAQHEAVEFIYASGTVWQQIGGKVNAGGGGGVTDGDKGDVVVSSSGAVWSLDYTAVNATVAPTFANISSKPTTVSGYGITDAVTLAGAQTVAGAKTFSSEIALADVPSPGTPAAGFVDIFGRTSAGRTMPAFMSQDGIQRDIQASICQGGLMFALAQPGATSFSQIGFGGLGFVGTATAASQASSSKLGYTPRVRLLTTVAATNAVAGFRSFQQLCTVGGTVAGQGGFSFSGRWGVSTGAANATHRAFFGLSGSSGSNPTDVNPSTILVSVGMGWDAGDTNIQIMHNDNSGTCTKVDLGASFPRPSSDDASLYELTMNSPKGTTQSVDWTVINLVSGASQSGTITTNLPATSQLLGFYGWTSAGGTSSVTGLTLSSLYLDLLLS